ncbi:MAG: PilZ domain-containing protein [Candidatus Omnitrophica bacterium]|nr:PilZ domain-containing protein [Candidatus Omnitrophota bacterium]
MQDQADRRKYIRLNSVFPVEFSLYFTPDKPASEEYQGFTSNVSEGGLCISVKNLKSDDERLILQQRVAFNLSINMPLFTKPIFAKAEITWSKKDEKDPANKTILIGLSYKDIKPEDKKQIINYARRLKWLPRLAAATVIILFSSLLALSFNHIAIRRHNQALVEELVYTSEVKSDLGRRLNELKIRKEMFEAKLLEKKQQEEGLIDEITGIEIKTGSAKDRLEQELNKAVDEQRVLKEEIARLSTDKKAALDEVRKAEIASAELKEKIDTINMELSEVEKQANLRLENLQQDLDSLRNENRLLKQEIITTETDEALLEEQLAKLKAESGDIEEANIDKMLEWIKVHQTKRTGLVLSYEGDKNLKDVAFTYDQALAVQLFLLSGNNDRAKAILSFYKNVAKISNGLFYNAYDVKSGAPSEYTIHGGPNIWIAISASQYTKKTGDKKFLAMAEDIANIMITMQTSSPDQSIKGGPEVEWVSTEHNLDAYALFNMLYQLTNNQKYQDAASKTLNWLKDVGYNKPEERFMRGRGDSTIATDTFSWAIAAIGPETLKENGMNPDGIMEFAETECRVEAKFYRPEDREIDVVGFDFAKAQNIGRGGIVSTEWTAQMIGAFDIMADYYMTLGDAQRENIYRSKARFYLAQLGKMAISSPSPTGQGEGCLPYASMDNVDTGHGWRVARGRRTGSVAATIYYIFAYKNYNPLSF